MSQKCTAKVEVYSRVCGFFRPVQQWNKGKKEEFSERTPYLLQAHGKKMAAAPEGGWRQRPSEGETSETPMNIKGN